MPYPLFRAESLDDLLREVYDDILAGGETIHPARGSALERTGVLLELANPRARLSRTETRGRLFSCLGEFLWYLSGTDDAAFIKYYIPDYPESDASGRMPGAYGPRLFAGGDVSQMNRIRDLLAKRPDSRQAVVQIFDRTDLERALQREFEDVPCTCTLQFLSRSGMLSLVVYMRSNDVFLGLTHDVFCFTMLQEIMASDLSLELGSYRHFVGSLHLYEKDRKRAGAFLDEGWQSLSPMPPVPARPWDAIPRLLEAEAEIRSGEPFDDDRVTSFDAYWADIVRLLLIFRYSKGQDRRPVERIASGLASKTYRPFVDARISRLK